MPATLAAEITAALEIPVIGIGAGPDVDGQILVLQDVLNVTVGKKPKFSKNFMQGQTSIHRRDQPLRHRSQTRPVPRQDAQLPEERDSMYQATSVTELRQYVQHWKDHGQSIAFIPTMGNLHAGHMSLIEKASR